MCRVARPGLPARAAIRRNRTGGALLQIAVSRLGQLP
jgi:hypothetical protein